MKKEIKEISQCVRELTITIESSVALGDYNKILRKYRKIATVPGFRKGKAPLSILENMYGQQAKEEYLSENLEIYFKEALTDEKINPVSIAEPLSVTWNKGEDFVAVFRYEVKPEIEIKKYKGLEIPFENAQLTDEAIDITIESLRTKMGNLEEVDDVVKMNDTVSISFTFPELNLEKEDSIEREIVVGNHQFSKSLDEKIIGKRIGDEFTSVLFEKTEDNNKFANAEAKISIKKIKSNILPVLNDAFAKEADYENMEEMRAKIGEELQKDIDKQNKQKFDEAVTYTLIKENKFEIPASIVESYAKDMAKPMAEAYKIPVEKVINQYRVLAEIEIKKFYILEKLEQLEKIDVTDNDIEEMIAEMSENMNISSDEYKEKYKSEIESDNFRKAIVDKKIYNLIKASSKVVPYPIPNEKDDNGTLIEDAEIIEEDTITETEDKE